MEVIPDHYLASLLPWIEDGISYPLVKIFRNYLSLEERPYKYYNRRMVIMFIASMNDLVFVLDENMIFQGILSAD